MLAFASPICAVATTPPLITMCGLLPKPAGVHNTKSASRPTRTLPTTCDTPCAMAGLVVYLDRYRRTRKLSCGVGQPPEVDTTEADGTAAAEAGTSEAGTA